MKDQNAIREVASLPLNDHPDLQDPKLRKVGEGVYYVDTIRFARIVWHHYSIDFKIGDPEGVTDWTSTIVTVSMTLGGGRLGRDHWGWPGEPFAKVMHGGVSHDGWFEYLIEDVGESPWLAGVFRWIRRGEHGASARRWDGR
ncbi:MAG: hypothetical protein L0Y72_26750 [Gemmataceae bacterium]|nr:hypothetical protein [Gemmataceae bacterium]MCI0742649.1 hypothetical protein [Gemmataceae bacterium]